MTWYNNQKKNRVRL